MPSPYSTNLLTSIERTITRERLTIYLRATGQDISKALELYEYNVHLSESLYGLLHGLEVTVRNAEHHALTAAFGTPSWFDSAPLSQYWRDQVTAAKAKPGVAGRPEKVISELTFGFWVDLLQAKNHRRFWVNGKLYRAFPCARLHRKVIHERLKTIQLLRNRISHHEPVLTVRNAVYNGNTDITLPELIECVHWSCPETALWIRTQFRYAEAERILKEVANLKLLF